MELHLFDCKKPCPGCPFLINSPTVLAEGRLEEIVVTILDDQKPFICHKTIDYTKQVDDGFFIDSEKNSYCAGAMIVLEKLNRPNVPMRLGKIFGYYDKEQLMQYTDMVINPSQNT